MARLNLLEETRYEKLPVSVFSNQKEASLSVAKRIADLIRMKQWLYWVELDAKLATSPRLLPELVKRFRAAAPVIAMLNAPLRKNAPKSASATSPNLS